MLSEDTLHNIAGRILCREDAYFRAAAADNMDSLLDEMCSSEKSYLRLFMMVLAGMTAAGAIAGAGFMYYTVWQTDHLFWQAAMGRVENDIVQENYSDARR